MCIPKILFLLLLLFISSLPIPHATAAELVDESYLHITWIPYNNNTHITNMTLDITTISSICYHCNPQLLISLSLNDIEKDVILDSRWNTRMIMILTIYDEKNSTTYIYETSMNTMYHAHYSMSINTTCDTTCTITSSFIKDAPGDLYYILLAIWIVSIIICMLIWTFTAHIRQPLMDAVATQYEGVTTWWKGTGGKQISTEPSIPEKDITTIESEPSKPSNPTSPKMESSPLEKQSIQLTTIEITPITDTPVVEVKKLSNCDIVLEMSTTESSVQTSAAHVTNTSTTESAVIITLAVNTSTPDSITLDIKSSKSTPTMIVVEPTSTPIMKKSKRLISLDTFRGMNVCVMIFVNYGGGYYWFFQHATWNGMTVADCVFPFFLFMMGVSITIAMHAMTSRAIPRGQQLYHIFRRSIIFFIFGLIISNTSLTNFRISGVLQRFAICYMICTITTMICYESKKSMDLTPIKPSMNWHHSCMSYIVPHHLITIGECVLIICMILIHLGLTFLWEVPGCGGGYVGPGGIGDYGMYTDCTGGAAGYIDRLILGESHLLEDPTSKPIYLTGPSDPEGILGYTTSIVLTYAGIITGRVLLSPKYTWKGRITRFLIFSVMLGVIGLGLCGATRDGGLIPLNKNLWSLSYILVTAALALLILSILYYIQDICQLWNGWVFHDMGKNSMMVYVGSELASYVTGMQFIIDSMNPETTNLHAIYLLLNTLSVWFWLLVSYVLTHT